MRWRPFLALILVGCGGADESPLDLPPRPVKVVELEAVGLEREAEFPGQVRAARRADLAFEVPGFMEEMLAEEGMPVEAGQVLARLDSRDYEASLVAARAQFEAARLEVERARSLFERNATSKQRLDAAESQFLVAEASFARAEKALSDTELRAPFAGLVAQIFVEDVVNVQAKQPILVVHDVSTLRVEVQIPETIPTRSAPERDFAQITEVVRPEVFLSAVPERTFPGKILAGTGVADPATRTFTATIGFASPDDLRVLPGMTANVRVRLPTLVTSRSVPRSFAVPATAVAADSEGAAYVWVARGEPLVVTRVAVTTGPIAGSDVEISGEDLTKGDLVVVSGVPFLAAGDQVRRFER